MRPFITAMPVGTLPITATAATSGWLAKARAGVPAPWQDVEDPGREQVADELRQPKRRKRGLIRGLYDDAVAGRQRSGRFPPAQNMKGWLNGMIRATTPRGSLIEKFSRPGAAGTEVPFISVTSPAKKSSIAAAASASPSISVTGLPPSAASSNASSRPWRRITAAASFSTFARSRGAVACQRLKEAAAALTAASTSRTSGVCHPAENAAVGRARHVFVMPVDGGVPFSSEKQVLGVPASAVPTCS